MKLENMYVKPIDRDIKGVIKVGQDDAANIYNELDEYVVTDELLKHFESFFKSYRQGVEDNSDKVGVWISGFFGSGKSHFLKILSYALANQTVEGKSTLEFFQDKITDTRIIKNMAYAADLTTDVVLFNIDAKSTAKSKGDKEAILQVFNNVFNELQGFSGITPWIADFERYLTDKNKYEEFKQHFEEIYGDSWVNSREDADYIADEVVEAYTKTLGASEESANSWITNAENNYTLNIETFVNRVKTYLDKKGPNHQVAFLVDEIGQYIGEDGQLMLNLQTIVEVLGDKCHGRAWVLVTSQQDIDSVSDKVKGDDFSKIMGRFDTRLSLSSKNVDEVIRKRLLEKNELAKETLTDLFMQQESILKNLLTFSSDTAEMKIYRNTDEFINFYPFIPYQFHLLQQVFNGVRIKGASGKHLSEGERSLLSAFQESAKANMQKEVGYLVPFSAFYETIDKFLEPTVSRAIAKANSNDNLTDFDVEVLKTLFLIKYANEIKANKENVTTLMLTNIEEDKLELSQKIESSFNRLAHETLIQQNGEVYDFLTNDEQDVNREIKNTPIDSSEIIKEIGNIISDEVYSMAKFSLNKYYTFFITKKIDDTLISSRAYEIGFNILTPYYGDVSETELKGKAQRESNLIIQLPTEVENYLKEIDWYLKINRFIQLKSGTTMTPGIKEIVERKHTEVQERKERARTFLKEAMKDAKMYANMNEVLVGSKDPKERINDGLKTIVTTLYNKLTYIERHFESTKALTDYLKESIPATATTTIQNKIELLQYLQRQQQMRLQVTVKDIIEHFGKPPYGWVLLDTVGVLISLYKDKELNFMSNSEVLTADNTKLIDYLTNSNYTNRVIIERRETIDPKLIKVVKSLAKELFDASFMSDDEDQLLKDFKQYLDQEMTQISDLIKQSNNGEYPGYAVLSSGKELIEDILSEKQLIACYKLISKFEDDLLDYFEDVEPVKAFYRGTQKETFSKALQGIKLYERNETYLENTEVREAVEKLRSITKSEAPYNQIPAIHEIRNQFNTVFKEIIQAQAEPIVMILESDLVSLMEYANTLESKDDMIQKITREYDATKARLATATVFDAVIAEQYKAEALKEKWHNDITRMIERENERRARTTEANMPKEIVKKRIPVTLNRVVNRMETIKSQQDIEAVLEQIREALEAKLADDTEIELR